MDPYQYRPPRSVARSKQICLDLTRAYSLVDEGISMCRNGAHDLRVRNDRLGCTPNRFRYSKANVVVLPNQQCFATSATECWPDSNARRARSRRVLRTWATAVSPRNSAKAFCSVRELTPQYCARRSITSGSSTWSPMYRSI